MNISRSIAVAAVACLPLLVPHKAHAIDVNISAEFTQATGNVAGDFSYSLNVQYGFIPDVAGNEAPPRSKYKSHVAAMGAGMVRYHQAAQMSLSSSDFGWLKTDGAPPTWDEAKIAAALSTSYPYGPVRMINIANWPPSMDDGTGRLKPSQYSNYAAFCAELVKILNIDLGYKIQYFEVFND